MQNVHVSREVVPGSAWRGALADSILRCLGAKASGRSPASPTPGGFDLAFGENARFGFLYPVPGDDWEGFPLPLTARSCKAHPGFGAEEGAGTGAKGGHGVADTLLDRLRCSLDLATPRRGRCPVCNERLDRRRGLAVRSYRGETRDAYVDVKVRRKLMLRVGIDRRTETAADGFLYALDTVVAGDGIGLCYSGTWRGSEEQFNALRRLMDACCPAVETGWEVRLGTAKARGLGKARLTIVPQTDQPLPPVAERLEAFQRLGPPTGVSPPQDWLYFALTVRSPLLVRDRAGVPVVPGVPKDKSGGAALAAYVRHLPSLEYVEAASAVEWEAWDGWSMAWGLPKPLTTAIAPGSVLVYRAPAKEREMVISFLEEVEEEGLGERKTEGWGEVVACDPFHVLFDVGEEADE
ncbi:MAG: CRISPR-associated RAMP protein Csx10 [Moorellales bacterium]